MRMKTFNVNDKKKTTWKFIENIHYDSDTRTITLNGVPSSWKVDDYDLIQSEFKTKIIKLSAALLNGYQNI